MSVISGKICAVVREQTAEQARIAVDRAGAAADLLELRLDYLTDIDLSDVDSIAYLLENRTVPAIITYRSVEEGGRSHVDAEQRIKLLVEGARRFADFCDIEAVHYDAAAALAPDLSRLIVSYHNFDETPKNIDEIYEALSSCPAAVHKIATHARTAADTVAIFRLLDRAQHENRPLVALAMGEPGLTTRILGPSRGSLFTYGSIEPGLESAPGQPTCEELRSLYRIEKISRDTSITGIIGNPVSHSVSPAMHNAAFEALNLDFVYLPIRVDEMEEFFAQFVRVATRKIDWRLRGLSVTIPHKISALKLVDEVDETAQSVGAVNTIVIDGEMVNGYNTDVDGFLAPLEKMAALNGADCAVIGAGGSARAAAFGLMRRGARVTIYARDLERARALEDAGINVAPIDRLTSSAAAIVINATPAGMHAHSEGLSPVPDDALAGRDIAYDLVYNPQQTVFLNYAARQRCRTIGGLDMLVSQAALQFKLWTGKEAPVDVMREAAIKTLQNQG